MKKLFIFISILGLIIGTSCSGRKPVFEKYHKFANSTWDRFNKIIFNVPIENTTIKYNITCILKPAKTFIYNNMPVYVIMNTPSGEERLFELKVPVKEDGKFIGEVEGQPVVIKAALWKGLQISEKGICKISIENMVPKIQTEGMNEIGIIVEQSESK
jgi:gliding motility-associated lipoprotein GldH